MDVESLKLSHEQSGRKKDLQAFETDAAKRLRAMPFQTAGLFDILPIRKLIFQHHYDVRFRSRGFTLRTKAHALIFSKVTLESIPQPEELPSEDRLLEVEDLEQYLSQLDPFMEFHGYKASSYSDWLQVRLCIVAF